LPLAVFLGCVAFPQRVSLVTFQRPVRTLSSSFAFLQSITQSNLAGRPRPTSSSHGLLFPTAHQGSKVHLPQVCQPATFRLRGLATLLTVYSLRSRVGLFSCRQRSWDSPFGAFSSREVPGALPPRRTHVPFLLSVLPPPKRWAGPIGRGSWVLALPRVPGDRRAFDPAAAGCSPGSYPSRVLLRKPRSGFRPISSHALRRSNGEPPDPPAPQSITRLPLTPAQQPRRSTPSGPSNPFRVFAPCRFLPFGRTTLRAMCSPRAASCITVDRPALLR